MLDTGPQIPTDIVAPFVQPLAQPVFQFIAEHIGTIVVVGLIVLGAIVLGLFLASVGAKRDQTEKKKEEDTALLEHQSLVRSQRREPLKEQVFSYYCEKCGYHEVYRVERPDLECPRCKIRPMKNLREA